MLNSNTAKERFFTAIEAKKSLQQWFAILSNAEAWHKGKRINGRAWRAEMRRLAPPYDVMMCEGYAALRREIAEHLSLRPSDQMALALFASVAVHIKSHNDRLSFAAQLGEKINDKPCMSALRFERLQQATDPEVFCQQLIRAVRLRGAEGVNIVSLADSIFLWMQEWQQREAHQPEKESPFERNRIRWANEYLSTAV